MQKEKRQSSILKLISARQISRQDELTDLLRREDLSVNQSSISRDLDELGIVKIKGFYALLSKPHSNNFGLLSVETAGNCLIIAKCDSGLASAVAVKIDAAKIEEIVGTIAGDDTIFIAVKDETYQKAAIRKIWEIFGN